METPVSEQIGNEQKANALVWLVVALLLIFVTAIFVWYYFTKPTITDYATNTNAPSNTTTAPKSEVTNTTSAITATLADLDAELAAMENDINSTDDQEPTL